MLFDRVICAVFLRVLFAILITPAQSNSRLIGHPLFEGKRGVVRIICPCYLIVLFVLFFAGVIYHFNHPSPIKKSWAFPL